MATLIHFHLGQYAAVADIEQIFHQLKVKEIDQDSRCFGIFTAKN